MSGAPKKTAAPGSEVADALLVVLGPSIGGDGEVEVSVDGLIHLRGSRDAVIVAEIIARPSAPAVAAAWDRLRPQAEAQGAVPVLVIPWATASIAERARLEAINWVDLAGNASVVAPGLRVHIEGKKRTKAPRLAPAVDPFARRSANLVRLLFVEPERAWRQKELVELSGLSQPRASKVLSALQEMSLVRREDGGSVHLLDPSALLDAWADIYSYRRQEILPAHMSGDGIELARSLQDKLRAADVTHWFTGLPAAWAYDQFAAFRLVSVFVDGDPDVIARDLGLRTSTRGANIHLIASREQKLEVGQADPDGLRCVHPTQVYLDLLGLPERAREAAEHLLPLALPRPRR